MLDIDGHVAGLDEEVADACLRVFHHQFAVGVVILRAAVADARQKVIDLIAQTALRQCHVQHHPVGAVLLHRRQGSAQAVQLIQIDGKADGTGTGGEFLHQQVIAAALEQRPGQGLEVALKHKAVVVFHLTGQRHIQPDGALHPCQRPGQRFQLGHSGIHGVILAQGFRFCKGLAVSAGKAQHTAQGVGGGIVQPGGFCGRPQLMGVLFPQLFQQGSPGGGGYFQRIEQTEEIAHVAHFQHPFGTQLTQRLRRQTHGLLHFRFAHFAQHFQTHLGDFLKGVALGRGAVDIFMIIVPQCLAGGGLCRLGDGEGHVRLERQQAAVQIGKGDDLLRRKEAAVFLIQAVFLKPAHVVLAAARRLVQRPQGKGGALLGLQAFQTEFHVGSPFSYTFFSRTGSVRHFSAPLCGRSTLRAFFPKWFCPYFTLS